KPNDFNPVLPTDIAQAGRFPVVNEAGDGFEMSPLSIGGIVQAADSAATSAFNAAGSAASAAHSAASAENSAEAALQAAAEDTLLFYAGETDEIARFVTSSRVQSVSDGEYQGYPTWIIEVKHD